LTSRVFAPTASHELARVVAALLAPSGHAASRLIARQPVSTLDRLVRRPTGLGTSAFRPFERATDDRSAPQLYCPGPVRDDEALGEEVNDRLVAWARQVGIYAGRLDHLRAANFGRLMMLTYPQTDDPDRLLAAGRCVLAEWAADDHYCDDDAAGADPQLLAPRLAIAMTALDPAHLPTRYAPELEQAMREDPVLVGLRSAVEHMPRYATPAQMAR
jgi:2-methylisoborneol synthase